MDNSRKVGPNVKRLIATCGANIAIPPGGGFAAGVNAITSGSLGSIMKEAMEWTFQALDVFKTAPDNPFGDDDEAIAGHILAELEKHKEGDR